MNKELNKQSRGSGYKIDWSDIIQLYKTKKCTRKELCEIYNLNYDTVTKKFRLINIKIWDRKKKKMRISKYFNWKELTNHPMVNYNRYVYENKRGIL